ncbi:MAG: hypothetical protein KC496_05505 [Anaerolineae bacterium]|nr:hypothetical protein [Anaerolineae bacterium]
MKLIVLTGLVSVEKAEAAAYLAQQFTEQDQRVTVLDNIARIPMDAALFEETPQRISGDISQLLPEILNGVESDVVILAASEVANPDDLYVALDALHDTHPQIDVQSLALIDTRTCDCFPQIRERLELYADRVLNLPIEWEASDDFDCHS